MKILQTFGVLHKKYKKIEVSIKNSSSENDNSKISLRMKRHLPTPLTATLVQRGLHETSKNY